MSYPHKLPSLTDREAIADAILRACIGIDTNDYALWESAMIQSDEGSFEMNGQVFQGREAIKAVFDRVGPMDTTHHISNIRVNHEEGADVASATCYGLHQHYRAGEGPKPDTPYNLVGGRSSMDFVRDKENGIWRMKRWVFNVVWRDGDYAVMGH